MRLCDGAKRQGGRENEREDEGMGGGGRNNETEYEGMDGTGGRTGEKTREWTGRAGERKRGRENRLGRGGNRRRKRVNTGLLPSDKGRMLMMTFNGKYAKIPNCFFVKLLHMQLCDRARRWNVLGVLPIAKRQAEEADAAISRKNFRQKASVRYRAPFLYLGIVRINSAQPSA